MDKGIVIEDTRQFVKQLFDKEGSGHDWWHIMRVVNLTKKLQISENADAFLCEMAALLHDVSDDKLNIGQNNGEEVIVSWLESRYLTKETIKKITDIISTVSYKGGNNEAPKTLEAQIVQDADRLDAIGAIGIARCFTYAGSKGQLIYDPNIKPRADMSYTAYREEISTAINHFYEKLLNLKYLMNTPTAKRLADERHRYMEHFLEQFFNEWEGNSW